MWPVCPHRAAPSESLLSMESKEFILSYYVFVALLSYDIILKHLHVFIQKSNKAICQSQFLKNRSTALPHLIYVEL